MNVMMDGGQSGTGGNAPPPFLTKTYDMVEDSYSNPIVSWSHNGNSFIVWNPPDFARDLLPKYFKHNNFSSFVRQLNTYGFRKIDPDQWEFANEEFIRGQRHLLKNIHRRKPIHSHSIPHQGNSSIPLSDSDRHEFEEEIERLKSDNTMLQVELHKYKHEKQEYEYQVCSLSERLQKIELGQRKMMASLAHLLQNPTGPSRFLQQVEINSKKRRLLISSYLSNEANDGDNKIITFQEESSDVKSSAMLNTELVMKLSTSLKFWGNFLDGVAHSSGEEMFSFGAKPHPSPSDSHTNNPFPSHLRDNYSSPELASSSNHADKVTIFSHLKSSGIDVNKEPFRANNVDHAPEMRSGPNDMFWEQFLTETPGGSDTQEVQSERRDINIRKNEDKTASERKYLWNTNNLDNLTEQMGLLSPSEKLTG